jgi:hypothetical protein
VRLRCEYVDCPARNNFHREDIVMAFVEQRGNRFRVIFKLNGNRFTHSPRTVNRKVVDAIRGGVERTILQIQQRLLVIPERSRLRFTIPMAMRTLAAASRFCRA